MHKKLVTYKGIKVWFKQTIYSKAGNRRPDTCPLCNERIVDGDDLYLIINNYKLFPNLYVHRGCAPSIEECTKHLTKMYREFEKIRKKYEFWLTRTSVW